MQKMYTTISLKLFGYGIKCLHDPNWTGMVLYDQIKQHVRGRVEPVELLRKPLERGLPYYLGLWFFDEYFSSSHLEYLHGEYAAWFLDDVYEMSKYHRFQASEALDKSEALINKVNMLYEENEVEYFDYLDSEEGMEEFQNIYEDILSSSSDDLSNLREVYAEDFADRMLHDRQLCFYVSKLVHEIGFNGSNDSNNEVPEAWVQRERWPERIKAILKSRDRGNCTNCGANLAQELEGDIQIDHMIPIAKGGCNDIVNLQILCAPCNRKKSANSTEVKSSVPKYLRRKST